MFFVNGRRVTIFGWIIHKKINLGKPVYFLASVSIVIDLYPVTIGILKINLMYAINP